ncbi:unnamed protein product [Didymodactylos carnosus]|nr:unnamed protein product [Didymodactylos carnosus]CAF4258347.1 unnamed protein product [Didymodactylos carnosus]
MIWPTTLVTSAFLRILHETKDDEKESNLSKWTLTRLRWFLYISLISFCYYWLPGYIFPFLSTFSIVCLIKPKNLLFSQVTGNNGLGLGTFRLDWIAITAFLGSPIIVPWIAQLNTIIGFLISGWLIIPIGYYKNIWNSKLFPIGTTQLYRENGDKYNITEILLSNGLYLNQTAYEHYGYVRLAFLFALSYGIAFAVIPATVVHIIIFHGKQILHQMTTSVDVEMSDIHGKLMSKYREVPEWWYAVVLCLTFFVSSLLCHYGKLMIWYYLFLCVVLVFFTLLPIGIIAAQTNQVIAFNIISQLVAGFIMTGDVMGVATFKSYGVEMKTTAIVFLTNLKLGHYMKIPPRITFSIQFLSTFISCVVAYITATYLLGHIDGICSSNSLNWSCPNPNLFYSASVIWGLVGPKRMFVTNNISYYHLLWFFLIGAFLPFLLWLLMKFSPSRLKLYLSLIHVPVIFTVLTNIATAKLSDYPSWIIVGCLFTLILRKYASEWWKHYAFVTSAALDCGTAVSSLIIFFIFNNQNIMFPQWWGLGGSTGDGCPLSNANYFGNISRYK